MKVETSRKIDADCTPPKELETRGCHATVVGAAAAERWGVAGGKKKRKTWQHYEGAMHQIEEAADKRCCAADGMVEQPKREGVERP
jgi:hypothetical protein